MKKEKLYDFTLQCLSRYYWSRLQQFRELSQQEDQKVPNLLGIEDCLTALKKNGAVIGPVRNEKGKIIIKSDLSYGLSEDIDIDSIYKARALELD